MSPSWTLMIRSRSGHFVLDSIMYHSLNYNCKILIGVFLPKSKQKQLVSGQTWSVQEDLSSRASPVLQYTHSFIRLWSNTYVQVWSIQQYMKSDRPAPAMQALIITQFNAWHFMSLPRSLSKSHPWSTSETPVGSVARSEAAPLPSRWAWPLHTALTMLTIFHQSSQKHVDLIFLKSDVRDT